MKHSIPVTFSLLVLFISAQVMGLFVLNSYIDVQATEETGVTTYEGLPYDFQRPDVTPNQSVFLIAFAVVIGTLLLLLIMKLKKLKLWKLWYLVSVFITLSVAWAAFIPQLAAAVLAAFASIAKVFRPNPVIHNLTELFIYAGLAVVFVPVLNVLAISILLLLISAYDIYAVSKSKHMVALAKFQVSSNLFAGIAIPKSLPSSVKSAASAKVSGKKTSHDGNAGIAIIGGGDIGFPLLFAGVVMSEFGFLQSFIIPVFATAALGVLFLISRKSRFYPAMPFVSAGCFVGYGVIRFFL